jgi:hypothetical protein
VLPIGILAVLLIAVPGSSRISGRLATVVVALAVIECVAWAAKAINDQSHLLAPTMLRAGMAFLIKTAQGLNARIIGIKDSVWDRGELLYGALTGLVGIVALAMAVVNTSDSASPAILIVGILFSATIRCRRPSCCPTGAWGPSSSGPHSTAWLAPSSD